MINNSGPDWLIVVASHRVHTYSNAEDTDCASEAAVMMANQARPDLSISVAVAIPSRGAAVFHHPLWPGHIIRRSQSHIVC
jgi:hypothetical protein